MLGLLEKFNMGKRVVVPKLDKDGNHLENQIVYTSKKGLYVNSNGKQTMFPWNKKVIRSDADLVTVNIESVKDSKGSVGVGLSLTGD